MKCKVILTGLIMLLSNLAFSQSKQKLETIIENQRLEEFDVKILKGKGEFDGIIQLKKNNSKPFIYKVDVDFSNLKNASDIISFEDFNFDGEKEIVIEALASGIYIYDRKTGKEKNLFEKTEGYGKPGKLVDVRNFINTYRGEYEINEKEKTIRITRSCSAACGIEEIYRDNGNGNLKLIRKCEWDEF